MTSRFAWLRGFENEFEKRITKEEKLYKESNEFLKTQTALMVRSLWYTWVSQKLRG
jgi:hypothetical protein